MTVMEALVFMAWFGVVAGICIGIPIGWVLSCWQKS